MEKKESKSINVKGYVFSDIILSFVIILIAMFQIILILQNAEFMPY